MAPPPPAAPDADSGVGYQSMDNGNGNSAAHRSLKDRLSDSLSSSSLSSFFNRPSAPASAPYPPASSSSTSPLSSAPLLADDEPLLSTAASTSISSPLLSFPPFFSDPLGYLRATSAWLWAEVHLLYSSQLMALAYLRAETKRNYRGFLIGLFTVLLVVVVLALIQNNTLKSPVIFFKVAENQVGETDVVLNPGLGNNGVVASTVSGLPLLNQSWFDQQLWGAEGVEGTSGRWVFFTRILSPFHSTEASYIASAVMLGIDTVKEKAMQLGRAWSRPPPQPGTVYLSRSIVRQVGYSLDKAVGQPILLRVDVFDFAKQLNLIASDGYADPTEADVIALLAVVDPDNFTPQFWQQEQTLHVNVSQVPFLNYTDANYTQLVHQLLYSNETFTIPFDLLLPLLNITLPANTSLPFPFNTSLPFPFPFNGSLPFPFPFNGSLPFPFNGSLPFPFPFNGSIPIPFPFNASVSLTIAQWLDLYDGLKPAYAPSLNLSQVELILDSVPEELQPVVLTFLTTGDLSVSNSELLRLSLPYIVNVSRYDSNMTIADVLDEPEGKWPTALGSLVLLENEQLVQLVQGSVYHLLDAQITDIDLYSLLGNASGTDGLPSSIHLPSPITIRDLLLLTGAINSSQVNATYTQVDATVGQLNGTAQSILSVVNYHGRVSAYLDDLEAMNNILIDFTNTIGLQIGLDYPAGVTTPIATILTVTQYIRYFLDNIFYSVVVLMVGLGVLLIFSLLLHDVDAKTYEYGMLRALGMRHRTLVQVLVSKAIMFSIPGIALGLLLAFFLNMPLDGVISDYAAIPTSYAFYPSAVGLAVVVGLIMPLLANIVPISRALSRTLRDSLDVYHHVVSDVTVRIIHLADLGLDLWQTALALLMVVVGFVTFYVVPYAFIFGNIPLFLGILNGILLGMLLGLCIIAQAVQPVLERVILRVMLWRYHHKLHGIVKKNLSGHRGRNAKTAQMFTICLAFIVFAGVMFSLQAQSLIDNVRLTFAADLTINALPNDLRNSLKEDDMREFLDNQIDLRLTGGNPDAVVVDYAFLPFPFNALSGIRSVQFSSLPQFQGVRNFVYGVPRNYLQVTYDEYFLVSEYQQSEADYPTTSSGRPDAIAMMYTQAGQARLPEEENGIRYPVSVVSGYYGQQLNRPYNGSFSDAVIQVDYTDYLDVLMGEALRGWQSVNTHTPLNLYTRASRGGGEVVGNYLCKARAMVSKVPGFFFSSYRVSASIAPLLIRQDEYDRLMHDALGDVYGATAPKQRLLIRLMPGATLSQREDVINGLRTFFKSDRLLVTDTASIIDTTMVAVDMMNLFFQAIGVITMLMCFFILWMSFTANVQENSWEFGVLRALGLNQFEVVMVYVYEALTLVLTSLLLGTSIGLLIAASLTAQFNLFTEMPFHMVFPHALFWTLVTLSLVISVVGSALPAYGFLKHTISNVLRGQ